MSEKVKGFFMKLIDNGSETSKSLKPEPGELGFSSKIESLRKSALSSSQENHNIFC